MSCRNTFKNHRTSPIIGLSLALVLLLPAALLALYNPNQPSGTQNLQAQRLVVKLRASEKVNLTHDARGIARTGIVAVDAIQESHQIGNVRFVFPPNTKVKHPASLQNVMVIDLPASQDLQTVLAEYKQLDIVEYAEPDWAAELYDAPNDPLYSNQWSLNNTGQGYYEVHRLAGDNNDTLSIVYGTPDSDIDALEVYENPPDATTTTAIVAMIDTGVDLDHVDLAAHIWRNPNEIADNGIDDDNNGYIDDYEGWDFCGNTLQIPLRPDNDPRDGYGHGTHCAGIITALTNNGEGVAGILDNCQIMALKFYPAMLSSYGAEAIVYAADNGADVISMSWGYPWPVQILQDALTYARWKGVVLVAAAGNDFGERDNYPASCLGVITVSATSSLDQITEFSTYSDQVEVCAPGLSILSLRAAGTDMYAPSEPNVHIIENDYYLASGTSMACPHVVGVAAYLRALSPGLSPDETQSIIQWTADDIVDPYGLGWDYPGWDKYSGSGRVNLQSAVAQAPHRRAMITSPARNGVVSGVVPIYGSADGAEFSEYTLEYGGGPLPTSWNTLTSSNLPVTDDLIYQWNTAQLEGVYTIRLRVGTTNAAEVSVNVSNSVITTIDSPLEGDTIMSGIDVTGSASAPGFDYFDLEYGQGSSPTTWHRIVHRTEPVIEGLLAQWVAATLSEGVYTLRVSTYANGTLAARDMLSVYFSVPFSGDHGWRVAFDSTMTLIPNYGDFDGDGINEIVIGEEDGLHWLNPDGTVKTENVPVTPAADLRIPVAVGDLDDDEIDDLVAVGQIETDSGEIGLLIGVISGAPDFAVEVPRPFIDRISHGYLTRPQLWLSDVDGDGRDEIHYFRGQPHYEDNISRFWVYNSDGSLRWETPLFPTYFNRYLPADLNGDGISECYLASEYVIQYSNDGEIINLVPLIHYGLHSFNVLDLSAVDVDNDGQLELVIFGVDRHTYKMVAVNYDLESESEEPLNTTIDEGLDPAPPIYCDIDGDHRLEYFITSYDLAYSAVYAFHADGSAYAGDSTYPLFTSTTSPGLVYEAVAADCDGDRLPDIVACAHPDPFMSYPVERLLSWNQRAEVLSGWPLVTVANTTPYGYSPRTMPVIGDVDRDGTTDIMMTTVSNELVFINLEGVDYDSTAMPCPFYRYNRRMDNIYRPIFGGYQCGDVDHDGHPSIVDAIALIHYIFAGGPAPDPYDTGDTNCDGIANITDAVYLVTYIFAGGNPPCDTNGDGEPDC